MSYSREKRNPHSSTNALSRAAAASHCAATRSRYCLAMSSRFASSEKTRSRPDRSAYLMGTARPTLRFRTVTFGTITMKRGRRHDEHAGIGAIRGGGIVGNHVGGVLGCHGSVSTATASTSTAAPCGSAAEGRRALLAALAVLPLRVRLRRPNRGRVVLVGIDQL